MVKFIDDFTGHPVYVGDKVIALQKNYRGLVIATVISVSAKTLVVSYTNTWNYADGSIESYRVYGDQFILMKE